MNVNCSVPDLCEAFERRVNACAERKQLYCLTMSPGAIIGNKIELFRNKCKIYHRIWLTKLTMRHKHSSSMPFSKRSVVSDVNNGISVRVGRCRGVWGHCQQCDTIRDTHKAPFYKTFFDCVSVSHLF